MCNIWRRPRFLPTFCLFERQKQHIVAIVRQKGKKRRKKKDNQIWSCFFWSTSAVFPQFQANFWLKGRQKTRPLPDVCLFDDIFSMNAVLLIAHATKRSQSKPLREQSGLNILQFKQSGSISYTICPKTITLQHLIFGQLISGAVT